MPDRLDLQILDALQRDTTLSMVDLGAQVGLSSTPCWKRVKEMEAEGVITGYTVQVDRKKVGLNLMVMAEVNLAQHTDKTVAEFEAAVQATPQIVRCYSTTGQADYVLMIIALMFRPYGMFGTHRIERV